MKSAVRVGARKAPVLPIVATALSLMCGASEALAWGADGHRAVARVAANLLEPQVAQKVSALLGENQGVGDAMAEAATWADEHKSPATGPWHFTDIPVSATEYDRGRDCPQQKCSVEQASVQLAHLADRSLTDAARTQAIRYVIHLVADIHQPLHSADNHDRGGNDVRVTLAGRTYNLHHVWDTEVVRAIGPDAPAVASKVLGSLTQEQVNAWATGQPVDWANEAHALARQDVYGTWVHGADGNTTPIILPRDYLSNASSIAAQQLGKAGVRLAMALNAALR